MERPIRILIVDDHPFFRQGVKFYLSSVDDFELVGEASNGQQALDVIDSTAADVILMDLKMPGMDGISTTRALHSVNPGIRILILTSFGSWEETQAALRAGAAGYCLKDAPPEELATAVRAVAGGGTYLGRGITPNLGFQEGFDTKKGGLAVEQNDPIAILTERELDVLKLLGEGLGNREIADRLVVSEKTVKTHVANILQKLEVKTRTQAALFASKSGLV